jgi:hypothetical protein
MDNLACLAVDSVRSMRLDMLISVYKGIYLKTLRKKQKKFNGPVDEKKPYTTTTYGPQQKVLLKKQDLLCFYGERFLETFWALEKYDGPGTNKNLKRKELPDSQKSLFSFWRYTYMYSKKKNSGTLVTLLE